MEVPLQRSKPATKVPVQRELKEKPTPVTGTELRIYTPGAATWTVEGPKLLKAASLSFWSVAATVMILGRLYPAGKKEARSLFAPSLPAAATKRIPAFLAKSMESWIAFEKTLPPRLALIT